MNRETASAPVVFGIMVALTACSANREVARLASPSAPRAESARTCGAVPPPLRRLTREQYLNTIRDLLGFEADVPRAAGASVASLPADETVGAFRSNVVAGVTGLDAEQYREVAEKAALAAAERAPALLSCAGATPPLDPPACAARFVRRFGLRAFRRPLSTDELQSYQRLFESTSRSGGPHAGLRAVVAAMLQSPQLLYHARDGGPYALASRLSYLLWNGLPDETLFAAASSGGLATSAGLRAQAHRMLADDRARRGIASFHVQWLGVEDVAAVKKDLAVYPLWLPSGRSAAAGSRLGDSMRAETESFADYVIRRGDGKLATLLSAPFSVLDEDLLRVYDVDRPGNFDPTRPSSLNPGQRAGVLTHASFLTYHAHPTQTSPINRGVLIRKNLLCQELPDPPPNVNNTPPDPDPNLTTRERFEEHRLEVGCAGCHKLIDPIGFGFEHYDGIGRYRAAENDKPIDATGTIHDGGDLTGAFDGAVELARRMARSRTARRCYARQWFRFAVGRQDTPADACSLEQLYDVFERSGGDIRELLTTLPTTDAFRVTR